jgi:hypothetical protein
LVLDLPWVLVVLVVLVVWVAAWQVPFPTLSLRLVAASLSKEW